MVSEYLISQGPREVFAFATMLDGSVSAANPPAQGRRVFLRWMVTTKLIRHSAQHYSSRGNHDSTSTLRQRPFHTLRNVLPECFFLEIPIQLTPKCGGYFFL